MRRPFALPMLAPLGASALLGCAAAAPAAVEWRVLVELVQPSVDTAAIESRASRVAGQPVRYAAAVSERSHALILACPSDDACQAALQRLRADGSFAARVDLDQRQRTNAR